MGTARPPANASPAAPPKDALAIVHAGAWFAALPEALRLALLEDATLRRLGPGEILFTRGDAFDGLYCVADGIVQIHAISEAGKDALLGRLEPGAWFGEICLFDGLERTHDARAVGATTLLHVPRASLERRLAEHPDWWREFGKLLAAKTRQAFRYVEEAQLLPPAARTARRLAAIARGYGNPPGGREPSHPAVHIPQEQLAQMLGLSRQTVNHALRELESRGLLRLHYAGIELLDLQGLETFH